MATFWRGQPGDEVVQLEHEADLVAAVLGEPVQVDQVVTGDPDRAGVRAIQRSEQVQQGGLTRARRSRDRHELPRLDVEGHAVDHAVIAEGADQIANGYQRLSAVIAVDLGVPVLIHDASPPPERGTQLEAQGRSLRGKPRRWRTPATW